MVERLTACRGCSRHVKASDPQCPFCGAPMAGVEPAATDPFRRMAAAAAVASAAVLAGCTSSTSHTAFYGAPEPYDGSTSDDSGTPSSVVFYGGAEVYDASIFMPALDAGPKVDAGADGSLDAAPDATEDASPDGGTEAEAPPDAGENG